MATSARVPERSVHAAAGGERRRQHGTQGGTAGNRSRIDSMKPALLFGGDCNAFVLWPCRPLDRRSPLGLRRRFAQDGVFFRARNKPEGSGGGKAGPIDAILHERMEDP